MTIMWPLNTHGGGDVRSRIISVQPCYEISTQCKFRFGVHAKMPSLAKGLGGARKWAESAEGSVVGYPLKRLMVLSKVLPCHLHI
jgi:hypothetical protein